MKVLLTIQNKREQKPVDPILVDLSVTTLAELMERYSDHGANVLIFQSVEEYISSSEPRV